MLPVAINHQVVDSGGAQCGHDATVQELSARCCIGVPMPESVTVVGQYVGLKEIPKSGGSGRRRSAATDRPVATSVRRPARRNCARRGTRHHGAPRIKEQGLMDALIAEAAARGQAGLELVSVDSTVVRAHHESAGLAVAGETLDALEQALTEEKGAPLAAQPPVWRVIRRRPVRARTVQTRRRTRIRRPCAGAAGPGREPLGSAGPEAD
ncbi:hypothetical protein [Streptomyces sp. NPDC045470]|uniref:hypothetical protein n=1 Tax=Streptomyces sp. NPDC045470 TaxID=3155469 RepID=UPI0033E6FECA